MLSVSSGQKKEEDGERQEEAEGEDGAEKGGEDVPDIGREATAFSANHCLAPARSCPSSQALGWCTEAH